ncbi:hypothetical protein HELRODRAFT_173439 [Helobdella robusta]|uniref:Uncharacterized protein n=1 Tax=Helobdella robusta TaxID=6412 RepID=T1F6T8_HELRO|nr:hypothetical protein HELRODRAFT_173439 [Helobdella robusta]ESO03738.1 hypothetical protein HELRODRAFT_173439 [Helobdella robusta]
MSSIAISSLKLLKQSHISFYRNFKTTITYSNRTCFRSFFSSSNVNNSNNVKTKNTEITEKPTTTRTESQNKEVIARAKHADYENTVLVYANKSSFGTNFICAFINICNPFMICCGVDTLRRENKWLTVFEDRMFIDNPHLYAIVTTAFLITVTIFVNFFRLRMLSKITYDINRKTFIGHRRNFMLIKRTFEFLPGSVVSNYPTESEEESMKDVSTWKYLMDGNYKINSQPYILLFSDIKNHIYFNVMTGVSNKY